MECDKCNIEMDKIDQHETRYSDDRVNVADTYKCSQCGSLATYDWQYTVADKPVLSIDFAGDPQNAVNALDAFLSQLDAPARAESEEE